MPFTEAYCGIKKKIPKGKHRGSMKECVKKGEVRYYGLHKVDQKILSKKDKIKDDYLGLTVSEMKAVLRKLNGKLLKMKKDYKMERDEKKKQQMKKDYKRLQDEFNRANKIYKKEYAQKGGSMNISNDGDKVEFTRKLKLK